MVSSLMRWIGVIWMKRAVRGYLATQKFQAFSKHFHAFLPPLCLENSHSFSKTEVRNHILFASCPVPPERHSHIVLHFPFGLVS